MSKSFINRDEAIQYATETIDETIRAAADLLSISWWEYKENNIFDSGSSYSTVKNYIDEILQETNATDCDIHTETRTEWEDSYPHIYIVTYEVKSEEALKAEVIKEKNRRMGYVSHLTEQLKRENEIMGKIRA